MLVRQPALSSEGLSLSANSSLQPPLPTAFTYEAVPVRIKKCPPTIRHYLVKIPSIVSTPSACISQTHLIAINRIEYIQPEYSQVKVELPASYHPIGPFVIQHRNRIVGPVGPVVVAERSWHYLCNTYGSSFRYHNLPIRTKVHSITLGMEDALPDAVIVVIRSRINRLIISDNVDEQ